MAARLGSNWFRWDLHVHTPDSIVHGYAGPDPWARFLDGLRNLPESIKAIGINDYFFVSGYRRVYEEWKKGNLPNIKLVLPVIELRLDTFCGSESALKKVNFHIIFSDEVTPEIIETQFLPALVQRYSITNDYDAIVKETEWQAIPNRKSLTELGALIKSRVPADKKTAMEGQSDLAIGFNSFCVSFEKVSEVLNRPAFHGKTLTAVGKTEWDLLRWSQAGTANKLTLIQEAAFVFTSGKTVAACESSRNALGVQGVNNRLLDCSDSHFLEDSQEHNRLGKCFTWIKGEICFETLRQAYYEYAHRVRLAEDLPFAPIHHINGLRISLPSDASWQNSPFCFRGQHSFEFHPSFTCLIGGRGSGKSTLLNLMEAGVRGNASMFKDSPLQIGNRPLSDFVSVDLSAYPDGIEFISQNEIERYASPTGGFTEAVIRRLGKVEGSETLAQSEEELSRVVGILKDREALIDSFFAEASAASKLESEVKHKRQIVQSVSDPVYKGYADSANALAKEKLSISNVRKHLASILAKLHEIDQTKNAECLGANNSISVELKNAHEQIFALHQRLEGLRFTDVSERESAISKEEATLKTKIADFLKEKKLSPENLQDIEAATKRIAQLEIDLPQIVAKRESIKQRILETSINETARDTYEKAIRKCLESINHSLVNVNSEVKPIRLEYVFDEVGAIAWLADWMIGVVKRMEPQTPALRKDHIQDLARRLPLTFDPDDEVILEVLKSTGTKTGEILHRIFSARHALRLLQNSIRMTVCDAQKFRRIEVYYDGKPFNHCSFGQRCTAVLVLLISIGNTPLIIDEPEAHLDSSLVANFLVDLVKRKKLERQLIFATHNANFVVNGDAELIYHLDAEAGNPTTVTSLTIEDTSHRKVLLALEGGIEAFRRRHRKYQGGVVL